MFTTSVNSRWHGTSMCDASITLTSDKFWNVLKETERKRDIQEVLVI